MADIRSFFSSAKVKPLPAKKRVVVSDEEEMDDAQKKPLPVPEKEMDNEKKKPRLSSVHDEEEMNDEKQKPTFHSDEEMEEEKKPSLKEETDNDNDKKKTQLSTSISHKDQPLMASTTLYLQLAQVFERVDGISSRNAIQAEMCSFFVGILKNNPQDLIKAVYLSINSVAPAFENVMLGVGDAILIRAICEVTGRTPKMLKQQYEEVGDLGTVVFTAKQNQRSLFGVKSKPLTLGDVLSNFQAIAKISGSKSTDQKTGMIKKLLVCCEPVEAKFLIRGLQGKLRIGLAESTILVSLAHAVAKREDFPPEDAVKILKQVYSECPSYDEIIPHMLDKELKDLHAHCHIRVGVPVKPMLAKPTKGVTDVLNRFEGSEFTCEFKYDGERAQIHFERNQAASSNKGVQIFSRNLESNTSKYPDAIEYIVESMKPTVQSFILDCEAVAYDVKRDCILPFQILSTRARKDVKSVDDLKVNVQLFLFDLLYFNGESLLKRTLKERRTILEENFQPLQGKVQFAVGKDLQSTEDILEFFNESIKGNCEGLMIKTLVDDATYEPSKRSLNWLKLKKDYMDNLGDSVDLVVVGAYLGKGKRTGLYGAFLCACFDTESEEFQSVCCVGTGFSEEALEMHTQALKPSVVSARPRNVISGYECDVWFDPRVVWEIKAADLSLSPSHKGALGLIRSDKGVGLRFPRFLRVREDKKVEDATSAVQIEQMYREQAVISQNGGGGDDDDDE